MQLAIPSTWTGRRFVPDSMSFKSTKDLLAAEEEGSFLELVQQSEDKDSGQSVASLHSDLPLHVSGNGPAPSSPALELFAGGPDEPQFDLSTDLGSVDLISEGHGKESVGPGVPMSKSDYNRMLLARCLEADFCRR